MLGVQVYFQSLTFGPVETISVALQLRFSFPMSLNWGRWTALSSVTAPTRLWRTTTVTLLLQVDLASLSQYNRSFTLCVPVEQSFYPLCPSITISVTV